VSQPAGTGGGSANSSFDDVTSLVAAQNAEAAAPAQHADPWAAVERVAHQMMSAVSSADDLASCMDVLEGITASAATVIANACGRPNEQSFVGSATASAEPAEASAQSEALSLVVAQLTPRGADAVATATFRLPEANAGDDTVVSALASATVPINQPTGGSFHAQAERQTGAAPVGVSPLAQRGVAAGAAAAVPLVSPSTPLDRLPEAVAYRVINGRALHAVLDGALADRESRARVAEATDRKERDRRLAVGAVVGHLPEQPVPAFAVSSPAPPAPGARVASSILLTEEKMVRFVLALDQAQARDQLLMRFRGESDALTLRRGTGAAATAPARSGPSGPHSNACRAADDTVRAIAQSVASAAASALAAASATTGLVSRAAAGPRQAGAPQDAVQGAVRGLAIVAAAVAGGEGDRLRAMMAEDDAARHARRERMEQERLRMLGMLAQTATRAYNH
jgi:hypothetical protein